MNKVAFNTYSTSDNTLKPSSKKLSYTPNYLKETGKTDNVDLKSKNTKKIMLIGLTSLAAAAGIAYAIKSGKIAKITETFKNYKANKNINIEDFKKNGKFENGIAKLKNKLFTGTINIPGKEGEFTKLTYKNGKIVKSYKSTITDMENKISEYVKKEYEYAKDGSKTISKTVGSTYNNIKDMGSNLIEKTTIFSQNPNIKTLRENFKTHVNNAVVNVDGNLKSVKIGAKLVDFDNEFKVVDIKTGKEILNSERSKIIDVLQKNSESFRNSLGFKFI